MESFEGVSLSAIVGLDLGDKIGLIYSIRVDGALLQIESVVPKSDPKIESITDLIAGADFHEREIFDLFGVIFLGHPTLKRLVLPEYWPKELFPLRKNADLRVVKDTLIGSAPLDNEIRGSDEGRIKILLGPQHPAMIEPERFIFTTDGETVVDVKPRIGYVHRGIEKVAEGRTYLQDIYLVERVCGICNACHTTCFCQAIETLLGVNVPKRALYLRTIILELNRIHSHMLLLGHAGLIMGYETLFHYLWRDRELIMELIEALTGNRVITSFITAGGVRRDIKENIIKEMKNKLRNLSERVAFYRAILEDDPTFEARTRNIGFLGRREALRFCVVGPVARASGIKIDVRKDEPYAAYDEIPFKIIVRNEGDSWARFIVRLDEINESINIIDYALNNLPNGAYRIKVPRVVPAGEVISRVEAPRGELFYYVKSNGSSYPERVKIRTPTFANILSFTHLAKGCNIADAPVILSSLDPCFSCTDR